jgi:hypothetical protein
MGYGRAPGFIGEWVLWVTYFVNTVEMVKILYIHTVVEIWRAGGARAKRGAKKNGVTH